jgi:hypothetical protein
VEETAGERVDLAAGHDVPRRGLPPDRVDGEEWLTERQDRMTALSAEHELSAFAAVRTAPGVEGSVDSLFGYGLTRFLDGVALLVHPAPDGRTARPTGRTRPGSAG